MKKKFSAALFLLAICMPTLALAAPPFKIPTSGCELAAMLGIINVTSCEGPPES